MESELLTVEEAAHYLQLNEQTVRAMARQGRLLAFKVGRAWRFRKADLDPAQINVENMASALSLLVIDDDPLVHALLEASLQQDAIVVHSARNGNEGLAILGREKVDVIFLDLSMPGMTGPETLGHIRQMNHAVPVVIITSHPEGDLMEQALRYGALTLLAKPFLPSHVMDCLEGVVGQRFKRS